MVASVVGGSVLKLPITELRRIQGEATVLPVESRFTGAMGLQAARSLIKQILAEERE